MKIKQYQGGGPLTSAVYTPNIGVGGTQTPSQEQDSGRLNIFDFIPKTWMNELVKKGLPNDVNLLFQHLEQILNKPYSTLNVQEMQKDILDVAQKINLLRHNQEEYDQARQSLKDNDTADDIATYNGGIFVRDSDGEVNIISLEDFSSNRGEYQPITNKELLYLRANDPEFTLNSAVFQSLRTDVNIKKVNDHIFSYLNNIKSDSSKLSYYAGGEATLQAITELPQILLQLGDDISVETVSNNEKLQLALTAIKSSLPKQYRDYLLTIAADQGRPPTEESLDQTLVSMLMSRSENKRDISLKNDLLEAQRKKALNGEGSSGGGARDELSVGEVFLTNPDFNRSFMLDFGGPQNTPLQVSGQVMDELLDNKGQPVKALDLDTAVRESFLGSIGNFSDAVIFNDNGKEITTESIDDYRYNMFINPNNRKVAIVNLPIKADGSIDTEVLSKGRDWVSDFSLKRDKFTYYDNGVWNLTIEGKRYLDSIDAGSKNLKFNTQSGNLTFLHGKDFIQTSTILFEDAWFDGLSSKYRSNKAFKEVELNDNRKRYIDTIKSDKRFEDMEVDLAFETTIFIPISQTAVINSQLNSGTGANRPKSDQDYNNLDRIRAERNARQHTDPINLMGTGVTDLY